MVLTDEDSALLAIIALDPLSDEQREAQAEIKTILASHDPIVDIHELFQLYNILYFRSLLLPRVEVSWSARLTLCAGICELVRDPTNNNKFTKMRLKLSEPLLKFRPRSDVINTLLHEAIHAYFFVTTSWRHCRGEDGTGHGVGFELLADAINDHGGYDITVFHTFHDEVDSYRTHVWQCDGVCKQQAPYFGVVKRSMNRAPGKGDSWWQRHGDECGGEFKKIAEPVSTKVQLERMTALDRAGRQKNKIDSWVKGGGGMVASPEPHAEVGSKRKMAPSERGEAHKRVRKAPDCVCPICTDLLESTEIESHFDRIHPP